MKTHAPVPHHSKSALTLTNSFKILILVGFVLVSGGTVLYLYSTAITSGRHARSSSGPGVSSPINAMFAGMFLETIFLVSQ